MLPARPRLRASFFFEGDAIACELTLMDERRALVHRQKVPVLPGSGLEQFHAALLSLSATLMVGGVPAAPSDPAMSEEELQAERERRDELRALGWHPSVLRVLPGDPPQPIAPLLTIEQVQAERSRRAAAQAAAADGVSYGVDGVHMTPGDLSTSEALLAAARAQVVKPVPDDHGARAELPHRSRQALDSGPDLAGADRCSNAAADGVEQHGRGQR